MGGEVRAISQAELRIREAAKMGFRRCLLPARNLTKLDPVTDMELVGIRDVGEARTPAADLVHGLYTYVQKLGEKYQVDEMAGKYEFTGKEKMTVPKALEVKEELEVSELPSTGWPESPGDYAASHRSTWTPADDIEARLDLEILLRRRR